jgi:pimeloyl-ACP methyl ester carboxylesterase
VREMLTVIDRLKQGIPGARKVVTHDVAHASNIGRPDEFNRIVLDFLASLERPLPASTAAQAHWWNAL